MESKKIFIIEDDKDICALLQELLKMEGYVTESASNGKEALEKLCDTSSLPSLILLDLMMPVMDGFQFREIQMKDPRLGGIPIVVMTADGNIVAKTKKLSATAFLKKPVDIDDVINTVAKYVL